MYALQQKLSAYEALSGGHSPGGSSPTAAATIGPFTTPKRAVGSVPTSEAATAAAVAHAVADANLALSAAQHELEQSNKLNAELQQRIKHLQGENLSLEDQIAETKRRATAAEAEVRSKESAQRMLERGEQQQAQEAEHASQRLQQRLHRAEAATAAAQRDVARARARITQLEAEVVEKSRALTRAQHKTAMSTTSMPAENSDQVRAQAMLIEELQESLRDATATRQRLENELSDEQVAMQALRRELAAVQDAAVHEQTASQKRNEEKADVLGSRLLCVFNRIRKLIADNYTQVDRTQMLAPETEVVVLEENHHGRSHTAEKKTVYSGCVGTIVQHFDRGDLFQVELRDVDQYDESCQKLPRSALWVRSKRSDESATKNTAALERKVKDLEKQIDQLEDEHIDELGTRDDTIEDLRAKVSELQSANSNSAAKAVIAQAQNNIDTLTTRVHELESQLETANNRAEAALASVQEAAPVSATSDHDETIRSLELELATAQDRVEQLQTREAELIRALEQAEHTIETISGERDTLKRTGASAAASAPPAKQIPLTFADVTIGAMVQVLTDFDEVGRAQARADMEWGEDSRNVCGKTGSVVDKDDEDDTVQVKIVGGDDIWLHVSAVCAPQTAVDSASPNKESELIAERDELVKKLATATAKLEVVHKDLEQAKDKIQALQSAAASVAGGSDTEPLSFKNVEVGTVALLTVCIQHMVNESNLGA